MYLCYIDESGTPEVPGNSTHFILAGISLPIWHWKLADEQLAAITAKYGPPDTELHTAWLRRKYPEQEKIPNIALLDRNARRFATQQKRSEHLLKLQRSQNLSRTYKVAKKNFHHTEAYIHLTYDERIAFTREAADCIGKWGFARLFAECINKVHFNPTKTNGRTIEQQAFEQIVSRFERYLVNISRGAPQMAHGLLVHDNNQTVAQKHTRMMREFHRRGTLWTGVDHIIETPMFVSSALTRMVQAADLCSYAIRRYIEFGESDLFDRVFLRADRAGDYTVGVRHFTVPGCTCKVCATHS